MQQLTKDLQQLGIDATSPDILVEQPNETGYLLTVPGTDAVPLWHKLRDLVSTSQYWPVILGTDLSLWNHRRRIEAHRHLPAQDIIARSLQIDPIAWLVQRAELAHYPDDQWFAARLDYIRTVRNNHLRSLGYADDELWDPWQVDDQAPANPLVRQPHTFVIPTEIVSIAPLSEQAPNGSPAWLVGKRIRQPAAKVYLGLLPTTSSWHIPALLKYVRWNDSPEVEEHVAVWKRWSELYGAEIVGIADSSVELHVSWLPADRRPALQIAWEHLTYCLDINEPLDS